MAKPKFTPPDENDNEMPSKRVGISLTEQVAALQSKAQARNADERQRRENAVNFARSSIGLEGFKPSKEEEAHAQRFIKGEIDLNEFVRVKAKAGPQPGPAESIAAQEEGDPTNSASKRSALLPVRHPTRDFFTCDIFDYALKDDGASMEAPIFTLSTKKDLSAWQWESKDGSRRVEVYPSIKGRATQFDKDVLIYIVSQMTEALNKHAKDESRPDVKNRTVRFTVYNYLVATNKPTGGSQYQRIEDALERLRGTSIKTDIKTGGQRVKEGFGIIDSWTIVEKSPDDERMIAVEVSLSKWLYNAVQAHEVLTIHPDYFRLRKPLERRLYELARKHCGRQSNWSIGLELLQEKTGSKGSLREFRRMVKEIAELNTLPEYVMHLDLGTDQVTFWTRSGQVAAIGVVKPINPAKHKKAQPK